MTPFKVSVHDLSGEAVYTAYEDPTDWSPGRRKASRRLWRQVVTALDSRTPVKLGVPDLGYRVEITFALYVACVSVYDDTPDDDGSPVVNYAVVSGHHPDAEDNLIGGLYLGVRQSASQLGLEMSPAMLSQPSRPCLVGLFLYPDAKPGWFTGDGRAGEFHRFAVDFAAQYLRFVV
jgi:hypothetical protein